MMTTSPEQRLLRELFKSTRLSRSGLTCRVGRRENEVDVHANENRTPLCRLTLHDDGSLSIGSPYRPLSGGLVFVEDEMPSSLFISDPQVTRRLRELVLERCRTHSS